MYRDNHEDFKSVPYEGEMWKNKQWSIMGNQYEAAALGRF